MPRRAWLHLAVVVVLVKLCFSCIDPGEFICEEATAKLRDCCPDFDPSTINCDGSHSCDVNYGSFGRDMTDRGASCLRDRSCDELRTANICEAIVNPPRPISAGDVKSKAKLIEEAACVP